MGRVSPASRLVKEYLDKFPKHGDHTVAKALFAHNPDVFKTAEDARTKVRYYRGNGGKRSKHTATHAPAPKPKGNPFNLPGTASAPVPTFVLPKHCNNILVVGDFHAPYHDVAAITAAFKYGKQKKINTIIINGDLIDFHRQSRFTIDPRSRSTREEFDACRAILESMRKAFPTADIFYLKGNHCFRWEHWLMTKAPEIFGDPYFEMENRLGLNDLKIKSLGDTTLIRAGKLHIAHGHTIIRGVFAPVNPARGAFMKTKQSIIINHTHKVSEHTEVAIDGKLITCWSLGCLCDLNPAYSPHANNYAHGFAHVKLDEKGNYSVINMRILDGEIL